MKNFTLIAIALTLSLLLSACGLISNTSEPASPIASNGQTVNEVTSVPESAAPSTASTDPAEQESPSALEVLDTVQDGQSPEPSQSVSSEPETQTALTQSELDYFTDYFSVSGNNGFLLSDYDSPADIDLFELFYVGAGIASSWDEIPQEEVDAYLAAIGNEEVFLDLLKVTQQQVTDFLFEKTGKVFPPENVLNGWIYLEQYDAFYTEISDTNYNFLTCDSGYKTADGLYVLHFTADEGYGQLVASCTVTLYKDGEQYLIVSNDLVTSY